MTACLQVIPAFEEAIVGMKVGGVRRLIVPVELGYPGQPPDFTKLGPTPGNFSVQTHRSIRQAFWPVAVPAVCLDAT